MINKENYEIYHDQFKTFYGRTPEYYLDRLGRYLSGNKISFNVYAFFFGVAWLVYRKMYKQILYVFLLMFLFALIISILNISGIISDSTLSDFEYLILFIVSTILGFSANYWYIKKSISIIEKNISQGNDSSSTDQILKKKGGTSIVALIIFIILSIIISIMSTTLE
jgi:hypothetical protein